MWNKKLILCFAMLLITLPAFAHSGRLDGSGGHRVNKEWTYEGRYVVVKESKKHYEVGKVIFEEGNYHFHIQPKFNGYKDGIYIPVEDKEIKNTQTSNIVKSEENRVASKLSNIYHKPTCRIIRKIKEENIVLFEDKEDSEKNGYIPCKICRPEVIK